MIIISHWYVYILTYIFCNVCIYFKSVSIYFSDWFIDRRHCNLKWQENASLIREKINSAMQDMPPNKEIASLLSGTCKKNYFFCVTIFKYIKCKKNI